MTASAPTPTLATRSGVRLRRWLGVISAVVLLVICFFVAWNNGLRDRLIPRNFGVVEPGFLYRSGQISRWQIKPVLVDNHIQLIVALSADHRRMAADIDTEIATASQLGIERDLFPLGGDGTGQIEQYANAITAIHHARADHKPVLVHCVAGAQRTGGVIAAYELLVEHRPADQAYAQLRSYGHDPHDNPHLIEYLNSHMAQLAGLLVQRKVIPQIPQPIPQLPVD